MSKISDIVKDFITPIVSEFGIEVVEVEFAKKSNGDNLTIFIDKPGGILIEDCEKVHNAIDEPLDELNPTNDKPYTLNVSSLGIDRPMVSPRDYDRNIGEMIEVKLFQAIEKKKVFVGKLLSSDDEKVVIEIDNKEFVIEKKLIAKATKYIDF